MNQNKEPKKQIPISIKLLAGALAFGAAANVVVDYSNKGEAPIYQPSDMSPTANGTKVPDGMQAPVGEKISEMPGNPNLRRIDYGVTPDGQTLESKIITVPPTSKE